MMMVMTMTTATANMRKSARELEKNEPAGSQVNSPSASQPVGWVKISVSQRQATVRRHRKTKSQYTRRARRERMQCCVVSVRLVTGHLIIFAWIVVCLAFVQRIFLSFFLSVSVASLLLNICTDFILLFAFWSCLLILICFVIFCHVSCVCVRAKDTFIQKANTYGANCMFFSSSSYGYAAVFQFWNFPSDLRRGG